MSLIKVNTIQNANGTTALTIAANGQLSSVNTAVANVTTLNATSGVLATQNGMTGIAKAWVNFNGTGTVAIRGSFNVSSITDNGTGDYIINFTTAMPDTNFATFITASKDNSFSETTWIVTNSVNTSTRVLNATTAGTYFDVVTFNVSVFR
jgi:hypothetical protein